MSRNISSCVCRNMSLSLSLSLSPKVKLFYIVTLNATEGACLAVSRHVCGKYIMCVWEHESESESESERQTDGGLFTANQNISQHHAHAHEILFDKSYRRNCNLIGRSGKEP